MTRFEQNKQIADVVYKKRRSERTEFTTVLVGFSALSVFVKRGDREMRTVEMVEDRIQ
jgi:hypothetical protein